MARDRRVTYTRRHCYATKSNKTKLIKTPGGRLVVHYREKKSKGPRCGDCGNTIKGVKHLSNSTHSRMKKHHRRVTRAYGGSRCAICVKQRIIRAFLVEESKIVKKVLQEKLKKKE